MQNSIDNLSGTVYIPDTSALIENPELADEEIEGHITGPDFPTGGFVCGQDGIRDAYRTGRGRIVMRGKVGALIELGAGFNPILTVRENIYVNGAVLGFDKKGINRKFDGVAGPGLR